MNEDTYEQFRQDVMACENCVLRSRCKQPVVDRGNPKARMGIVGEAPGREEGREGKVFVGEAGRLLTRMCNRIDFDLEKEAILFNVIKCRPPANNFPNVRVVKKCLPHLDRQLRLLDLKVVVLAGRKAVKWILYRDHDDGPPPMNRLAGGWVQSEQYLDVEFFVIYHPAYLLRLRQKDRDHARAVQRQTEHTLVVAAELLDGFKPEMQPWTVQTP